mgnify:CR=1 FL=1
MAESNNSVEIIPALKYDLNEFEHTTVAEREAAAEAEKAKQEAELAKEKEAKEKEMKDEVEAAIKEKEEESKDQSEEGSDDSVVIEGFDEYIASSGANGEQYEMVEGTQSNLDELPETGLFADGDANMMPSILIGVTGMWVLLVMFLREKVTRE